MEQTPATLRPSFALLGADAFLAARPATPVQLAHACTRGGYDAAIPATWGDELIAERCIERLSERTLGPAVFCACSYVRDRLLAPGPDLAPFMLSFVAPPVAAARYLRQLYAGRPIDITYVGACPSADDEAIDRQVSPKAFFGELRARGIILSQQPTIFNSMFAPDRRRCLSQPGGLPTPQLLERQSTPRELVDIADFEYAAELAQHLILNEPVLIDLSTRSGCACSGAAVGVPPTDARAGVVALEPPRSAQPIVEYDLDVPVDLPIPVPSADRDPPEPPAPPPHHHPVIDRGDFPDWPTEAPRPEARLEPRVETRPFDANFEMQFDSAFRSAFTSVPLALPIPRQPSTESYGFPLVEREIPMVATIDSSRRRTPVPRARSGEGRTLPRAYVARRATTPPHGELVVRPPAPPSPVVSEPAPMVSAPAHRVSAPAQSPAPQTYAPLFAAFAASGVLSAATEGNTGLTRELRASVEPAQVAPVATAAPVATPAPTERPVPIRPTVESPRRRSAPVVRKRVVQPPRGLALIGHWLRQVRLRHLAILLAGLVTLTLASAVAISYLLASGDVTSNIPTPSQFSAAP
jgi:hypothetical protein